MPPTPRATRYEVLATKGAEQFIVGFTPRVSRMGLLRVMQGVGDFLIVQCGIGAADEITFGFNHGSKPLAYAEVSGWRIGFTGRTERDVASQPKAAQ